MKFRSGFVSNSSSSSFVCYGTEVDNEMLAKIAGLKPNDDGEYFDEEGTEVEYSEISYEAEKKLPENFVIGGPGEDYQMIGRTYQSMGDDETGKEFKESTKKVLTELLGKEVKPSHQEEGWMDY